MSASAGQSNAAVRAIPKLQTVLPVTRMVIGGARPGAVSGREIAVEDPSDETIIAHVPAGAAADIDLAVTAARRAFDRRVWSGLRPIERSRILENIARKIEEYADDLALLESYDNGKAVHQARTIDVPGAVEIFRYMAGWCTKLHGRTNPMSGNGHTFHSYTVHEPIGVVGAITPWNYPLTMASWKVATALAAGCTIVLKPSELTPLTALRLAELALEAGLPEGVLNVVTGHGNEAGHALVDHPGIAKIAFTGSTRVGKSIVQAASRDLKRITLELGGKSPSLVFADADISKVGPGAALAIFLTSGQICHAASRLYIEKPVFDEVVAAVCAAARSFHVGHGRDPNTMIGPLISKAQQHRVLSYIETGIAEGAAVATGGARQGDKGYFVQPTVFVNARPDSKLAREEIFGPVVVATPFTDLDAVIEEANNTRYGLAANIWTRDLARAHLTAARLQAGSVWINTHGAVDVSTPFGGMKESGWGREMALDGVHAFTETKTVTALLD
jgi:acyl-CoA reductase-like NAD-dependent aldehyde dehydrogenase